MHEPLISRLLFPIFLHSLTKNKAETKQKRAEKSKVFISSGQQKLIVVTGYFKTENTFWLSSETKSSALQN